MAKQRVPPGYAGLDALFRQTFPGGTIPFSLALRRRLFRVAPRRSFRRFRFVHGDNRVAQALMDTLSKTLISQSFRDEVPRHPDGVLHQAGIDGVVEGDHPGYVQKTSFSTRASIHPAFSVVVAALLSAAYPR